MFRFISQPQRSEFNDTGEEEDETHKNSIKTVTVNSLALSCPPWSHHRFEELK